MERDEERDVLGAVRVGGPLTQALETVGALTRRLPFRVRRAGLEFYGEHMLLVWLPRLIDGTLPTRALAALDPRTVKEIAFVLYRDMGRHHRRFLAPRAPDPAWVDRLFANAAVEHGLALPQTSQFELEDPTRRGWARELGRRLGVRGFKLFACHSSLVSQVIEQCSSCTPDAIDGDGGERI